MLAAALSHATAHANADDEQPKLHNSANGNMTVRSEMSGTETFTYTQAWTIDNRLASVTKTNLTGTVLAVTMYAFDGDGARVRKVLPRACRGDDPDGTTLYAGAMEQIVGAPGTGTAEYFDDASGATLAGYLATRSEPVVAGLQGSYTTTPPLPTVGDAPLRLRSGQAWAIRWQLWLTVPVTDTSLAVFADDGFNFSGIGLVLTNTTSRVCQYYPRLTQAYYPEIHPPPTLAEGTIAIGSVVSR